MNASVKALRRLCAVLTGFVFCISGLLKIADPVGTSLIVTEYFKFFGVGWLRFASFPCAVALSFLETVTGAALVCGVLRRGAALASAALLSAFTLITLILLIANPQMDCGCFGQAIHLTHAQSFLKNLILDALWVGAFIPFRDFGSPRSAKKAAFAAASLSAAALSLWCIFSLPPVDFAGFAPGSELAGAQDGPEYDGGALLSFRDEDGQYSDTLALDGDVCIISVYRPGGVGRRGWRRIDRAVQAAQEAGYSALVLVCGTPEDVPVFVQECFYSDYRTLISLNRSNGGVTCLFDGMVVRKWSARSFPADGSLAPSGQEGAPLETVAREVRRSRTLSQGFLLYFFAIMLLL